MNLHWDRFGSFLSELWAFLGPPFLNLVFVSLLFWRHLVAATDRFLEFATDAAPPIMNFIASIVSTDWVQANLDKAPGAALSALLAAFIMLAIFAFILDSLTRLVGAIVPPHVQTNDALLVQHARMDGAFKAYQTELGNKSRLHIWLSAKAMLDSLPNLGEYRAARDGLKNNLANIRRYHRYICTYALLLVLTLALDLANANPLLTTPTPATAPYAPNVQDVAGMSWAWLALTFAALVSAYGYFYIAFFCVSMDIVRNDLEMHSALALNIEPDSIPDADGPLLRPHWLDCTPLSVFRERSFLPYSAEAWALIGRRAGPVLGTVPHKAARREK
ncbi:MAG: hypothetical protein AAF689_12535 [Pseudomonadota bacterium]